MGAKDIIKKAGETVAVPPDDKKTVFGFMKAYKDQIALALPKHMNSDRMVRVATTCFRTTPKLLECTPESLFGAIIQCAQLGLEPGNGLGHAYLLPFDKNEKRNGQWVKVRTDVQLIIGYRGMLDLARRSGQIESISAYAVYDGDKFEAKLGLEPSLLHEPDWENAFRSDPNKIKFVYAVARLKDGGVQFMIMSRADVENIRKRSKAKDSGPWVTDYEQMALKTVTRRLFKWLPVSIEMQQAVAIDEATERGQQFDFNAQALNGEYIVTPPIDDSEPQEDVPAIEDNQAPSLGSVLGLIETATSDDEFAMIQDLANSLSSKDKKTVEARLADKNPAAGLQF